MYMNTHDCNIIHVLCVKYVFTWLLLSNTNVIIVQVVITVIVEC